MKWKSEDNLLTIDLKQASASLSAGKHLDWTFENCAVERRLWLLCNTGSSRDLFKAASFHVLAT